MFAECWRCSAVSIETNEASRALFMPADGETVPYSSNNNAILFDNCNPLHNLTVRLDAKADIATVDGSGWRMQLNCYPPAGFLCGTTQVVLLQFSIVVQQGALQYLVLYWGADRSLPCWGNDDAPKFATGLSGDRLPRGSELRIAVSTDSNGVIDTATFTYMKPDGNAQTGVFVPQVASSMCAFQLDVVGPLGGGVGTFLPSVPNALVSYSVSPGTLSVQNGPLGSACGEVNYLTYDKSNVIYSDIAGAPGSTLTQTLQQGLYATPSALVFFSDPKVGPSSGQQVGTTSLQQTVTVYPGPGVTLTGIALTGYSGAAQYVCVPPAGDTNLSLQNGFLVITVWFRPTVVGLALAQLQISHTGDGGPLVVELQGLGTPAPKLPLLNVAPISLLFTTKSITNHVVTLSNSGTAPLTIKSIAVDNHNFTFGTTCPPGGGALNPGQTCTVTVSYHGIVYGSGNLAINHNAAGSPTMVSLEANVGTGPPR